MLRSVLIPSILLTVAFSFAALPAQAGPKSAEPSASPTASPTPVPTAGPIYQSLHWREIGPALPGGRVANAVGSARDPELYYLGAAGGGVWKSTDGGESWSAVFEKQGAASIGDVAIDPTNDNVVWVATGEGNPRNDVIPGDGIYKSIDGGKTWTHLGLENTRSITRILIDPQNPNHVLVAALGDVFGPSEDRGIYLTEDGGKTWSKTLYVSDQSGGSDLAMDPHHPNVVYAGIWHFLRRPWTTNSGGPDDGLYKSTDGGKTWTQLTGHGLPTGTIGRIGLAVAPTDGNRVYALIESKQGILWRSDDGGANWTLESKDTVADQRPFYFSHIVVDPSDENKVYGVSMLLVVSKDGGKHFTIPPNQLHSDNHDLWIAPNDPKRMILSDDGGIAVTRDGGGTWFFGRNIPIGEVYHAGVGATGNPYWVCGGWQDNLAWCGPGSSTDPSGILNKDWILVAGGDGEWGMPDPIDPNWLWADTQQGALTIYNKVTRDAINGQPYMATAGENFDQRIAKYRFNWDSPIAYAPWDPHIFWLGGNVVFQTIDRGIHWKPISPDLTLNEKEHQQPAGGPITHDVSSAENYNTILDIEGSTLSKGEIWVGTDDGQVQLTRDGGAHWRNVSPKGIPDHGEIETVAPSSTRDGTAYISMDRHLLGDRKPYLFVTHNFGNTWTPIVNGLPADVYVRAVRPDPRNPQIVYAGTETGIFISCDAGGSWHDFKNDLPTVSVRDIRFQTSWDDMVIATHGRSLYVLDDLRPLQQAACATPGAPFMIAPRVSYQYNLHGDDEGIYTDFSGTNAPFGAVVWYYQPAPGKVAPTITFLDDRGRVVRTVSGTHQASPFFPKEVPWIKNDAGLQQFVWDYQANGPTKWNGAAGKFFKGPDEGAALPPGRYTIRMTLDGRTFTQPFVVKDDPDTHFSHAQYVASYVFANKYFGMFSRVDDMLNALDNVKTELTATRLSASQKNDAAALQTIDAALAAQQTMVDRLTANYVGFEDFVQRSGKLREDLQQLQGEQTPLTPAMDSLGKRVDAEYAQDSAVYNAYLASFGSLNAQLKQGGYPAVAVPLRAQ